MGDALEKSYQILGSWDYSLSSDTSRWSTPQTITVTTGSFAYKPNRIKIRGHGKACQFKITNNSTNPFNIIGWAIFETGNKWI